MSAAPCNAPVVEPVHTIEPTIQHKLLHTYSEAVNYLLKKFSYDQYIAWMDSAILRYKQLANMKPIQYAEDLNAKSCKGAKVYDHSTLNEIIMEGVTSSVYHSLGEYWSTPSHVDIA